MIDETAAYAALELSPGAGWEDIERAYKRLIGTYHPDRAGGDSGRAAEITQAYLELRRARDRKNELEIANPEPRLRPGRYRWLWAVPGCLLLAGVLMFANSRASLQPLKPPSDTDTLNTQINPGDLMAGPLAVSAITKSVDNARRLAANSDEMALASASRDCQRRLRASPSVELFDRCAAFDDAVIQLQDRDPLRDQGPFSEIAVTSRRMSAASLLSEDSLAIDGRLDRIRRQVELALAPAD